MLQTFRSFASSKFGVGITIGFLALLMLAFAGGDIAGYGGLSGGASGTNVAKVGGKDISQDALRSAATSTLERLRDEDPRVTMRALVARGALPDLLDSLIDRFAMVEFGVDHGIVAGKRMLDRQIGATPAFKGLDGQLTDESYRIALAQLGLTDAKVREDFTANIVARQLLVPAAFGATFPDAMALQYARLLKERRGGGIALIPSAAFTAAIEPSDAQLQAYYAKHASTYLRPERRVIRYATFTETALKNVPAPSEAEIAARYKANAAQYSASETRTVTQLILPTEAAARALLGEVKAGKSLEAAAAAKGLNAASIGSLTRDKLAGQSSDPVAAATFGAARGAIAGPVRSGLGWHLMRIDTVTATAARSLDQARGEIAAALAVEKRRKALSDFTAEIEDEFDNGGSLSDVAKQLGLTLAQTAPVTADGAVYGQEGQNVGPELVKVLGTAFAMEGEQQPQIAEIEPGKSFLVYDVSSIAASAPAPLGEIRERVATDFALEQGAKSAMAAAERVAAALKRGQSLDSALGAVGVAIPPVDRVDMSREELIARQQQVPPPLRLLFSMASGTTKVLPAPRNRGFYVVQLGSIVVPPTLPANDPLIADARRELGETSGREFAEQLRGAIRKDVGVSRNEDAVKALTATLTGGS